MGKGKLTVYLVRHAQTSGNVNMELIEAESDKLTNLGKIQTNLLGMHLSSIPFDRVFSSDYNRAMKTAEGILKLSKVSCGKSIEITSQLREVNFGIYEKTSYTETFAYCSTLTMPVFQWEFPEGESFSECGQRMINFIEGMVVTSLGENAEHRPVNVLLVSHSASIACFLNSILESTIHDVIGLEPEDRKLMRNTCYLKFEVENGESFSNNTSDMGKLKITFVEKFYSKHLDCIGGLAKSSNALATFAGSSGARKKYLTCVQQ